MKMVGCVTLGCCTLKRVPIVVDESSHQSDSMGIACSLELKCLTES